MPERAPLPRPIAGTGFSVARAKDLGVAPKRLRAQDLTAPVGRGVRVPAGCGAPLVEAARALTERFPGTVVSHRSAALLWGMRVPDAWRTDPDLHLTRADDARALERANVRCRRSAVDARDVSTVRGVPVTSPARTFLDVAADLSPARLVALGDGLVCVHEHGIRRGTPALCTPEDLARTVARHRGKRGVRRARAALDLVRTGVDSVQETRLRLLLQSHGITGLVTGFVLLDDEGFAAVEPDLALPEDRLSIQYEGAHHDDHGQRVRDIHRQRRTERFGWREIRVHHHDLVDAVGTTRGVVPTAVALVWEAHGRAHRRGH